MSQFWSPVVHTLTPYVPGEQPKLTRLVKLNTNENPYPPSPKAIAAMQAGWARTCAFIPIPTAICSSKPLPIFLWFNAQAGVCGQWLG